jgi:hypothetical protein
MTRWGDYIVIISASLNACALLAYLIEGYYVQSVYWLGALLINLSVMRMK